MGVSLTGIWARVTNGRVCHYNGCVTYGDMGVSLIACVTNWHVGVSLMGMWVWHSPVATISRTVSSDS